MPCKDILAFALSQTAVKDFVKQMEAYEMEYSQLELSNQNLETFIKAFDVFCNSYSFKELFLLVAVLCSEQFLADNFRGTDLHPSNMLYSFVSGEQSLVGFSNLN